jgi:hypothetical protein
LLGSD